MATAFTWDFMVNEWAYFTGAVISIFFIVDPFGVVPVYMGFASRFEARDQVLLRRKATFIATAVLCGFAFTGMRFFQLFGITLPAFQIGGGLLLLRLGIRQLEAERRRVGSDEQDEGLSRDDISLFPLATPLLAGPAAISTVILYASKATTWFRLMELLLAILVTMLASYLILGSSRLLFKVLGHTGLNLMTRLMGLVLTAVAVQFILNGGVEAWRQFGLEKG